MLPPRDPLQMERYTHPKSTGTEKGMPCKWKGKTKAEVAELISNKIDFKTKTMVRDKERRYIMIKGTIQHEDVTLVNMYIPKTGAPKHAEQIFMDIKGERDRNAVIIGVNTPLTSME